MRISFLRLSVLLISLFCSQAVMAQSFSLHARVTMAPIVTGPSGYFAALTSGAPLQFELVDLNNGMVALRDPATGHYARTGNTQYEYLDFGNGGLTAHAMFEITRSGADILLRSVANGRYFGFNMGSGRLRAAHDANDPAAVWRMQEVEAAAPRHVGTWALHAARDAQGQWVSPVANGRATFEIHLTDWGAASVFHACGGLTSLSYRVSGDSLRFGDLPGGLYPCDAASDAMIEAVYNAQRFAFDEVGQLRLSDANGRLLALFGRN